MYQALSTVEKKLLHKKSSLVILFFTFFSSLLLLLSCLFCILSWNYSLYQILQVQVK